MPDLIALMGIPASGKSTHIEQMKLDYFARGENVEVVSPDQIRLQLTGDMSNQDRNSEVFMTAHALAGMYLRQDKTVIWDATNVTARARRDILKTAAEANALAKLVVIDTPLTTARQRNAARDRVVPEHVLDRMYRQFVESLSQIGHELWFSIEKKPCLG